MELKVEMYVRTNLGNIGKIEKEYTFENGLVCYPEPQEWVLDNGYILNEALMYSNKENITKASDNILDLIQEEDIVNGILIESIYERTKEHLLCHAFDEEIMFEITKDNIDYILTKEEIERRKYEVK